MQSVSLYRAIKKLHSLGYIYSQDIRKEVMEGSLEDIGDQIFLLKRSAKFLDDLAKEIRAVARMSEKLFCVGCISEDKTVVKGRIVKAYPKVKHAVKIPSYSSNSEDYEGLLGEMGVPKEAREILKPNWPKMIEMFSERISNGEKLPPQLDPTKTYPVYSVLSMKANVDETLAQLFEDEDERFDNE